MESAQNSPKWCEERSSYMRRIFNFFWCRISCICVFNVQDFSLNYLCYSFAEWSIVLLLSLHLLVGEKKDEKHPIVSYVTWIFLPSFVKILPLSRYIMPRKIGVNGWMTAFLPICKYNSFTVCCGRRHNQFFWEMGNQDLCATWLHHWRGDMVIFLLDVIVILCIFLFC